MPRTRSENSTFDETAYKREYGHAKYDRITLYVPKGKRDKINAFADLNCTTVNALIQELLDTAMKEWQEKHPREDLDRIAESYAEQRRAVEEDRKRFEEAQKQAENENNAIPSSNG